MKQPHILLISLETLRRDHLHCYGYPVPLMPNLDRLAGNGVRCAHAVANCGWTLPQHMTLHTGCYPLTHGCLTLRNNPPVSAQSKLLAEHLQEAGYKTFAGVNSRNHYGGGAAYGFARGFDEHVPGAAYNQHMDWTEQFIVERFRRHHTSAPVFVYVHVNDSHEPWEPPEPWLSMYGPSYHSRYEGQLAYVDHYLGKAFAALKDLGIYEETLIAIFADHGTEFAEHGFYEKKVNLYNEILHVPLIFHYPAGLPAGRIVEGLAESAQVAPTIVELAGLPPLPTAQGTSLVPRLIGTCAEAPAQVCSHTRHEHQRDDGPAQFDHYAIQTMRWKFIRLHLYAEPDALHSDWKQRMQTILLRTRRDPSELAPGTVIRELYDLSYDPGEQCSLVSGGEVKGPYPRQVTEDEAMRVAAELEARLDAWIGQTAAACPGV